MSNYRRARVPGATYFITVNLRDRRSDLLVREIDLLRATVRATATSRCAGRSSRRPSPGVCRGTARPMPHRPPVASAASGSGATGNT